MTVMTTQLPLPLIPTGATEISAAAAMIQDEHGGRVFVHGNLAFASDGGDTAGRRFAAVSLMRIKAATQVQVAAAFGTSPLTLWRWAQALSAAGVSALVPHRKGPRRACELTPEVIATIVVLRGQGLSLRAIGERVSVSEASVRRALADTDTDTAIETETDDPTTVSDTDTDTGTGAGAGTPPEPVGRPEPVAEPELGSVSGGAVAVLADPVDRGGERALAAFGLIPYAPPVFTGCGRAPLAGLFLALPALAATGLLEGAHTVYGELPNGFYSLDAMLCEGVFRALLGEARAEGAARIDPPALGRVLGLDRAPEVKTIRRKIGLLAAAGRAGDWIAAMAARHVEDRPEQAAVLYVDGHVRAYQGTRKIAKTHVPRLKFPAPATVRNLGRRRRGGSAAGGAGRTGRLAGLRVAPVDPPDARHGRRRPPGAGRVRPRRLVGDPVRRPGCGRVRHPHLAQGHHRRPRRGTVRRARPHRRTRPHPHLGTGRHRGRVATSPTGHARARCSRCARSACTTPLEPARCTS